MNTQFSMGAGGHVPANRLAATVPRSHTDLSGRVRKKIHVFFFCWCKIPRASFFGTRGSRACSDLFYRGHPFTFLRGRTATGGTLTSTAMVSAVRSGQSGYLTVLEEEKENIDVGPEADMVSPRRSFSFASPPAVLRTSCAV